LNFNFDGLSILFKYFKENYIYNKINVLINNDYSSGNKFKKLGFVKDKEIKPDYFYINTNNYIYNSGKTKLIF
jgi:hypothetical protein